MGVNSVGNVGNSWHALQAQAQADSPAPEVGGRSTQHDEGTASPGEPSGSAAESNRVRASGDEAASNSASNQSGSNQSGSTHIVDHSKSSDSSNAPGQSAPADSTAKTNGQNAGNGNPGTDAQQNTAPGNQGSVTLRPQDNAAPQSNGDGLDAGKLNGNNAGWGDGIGGGQNKGFSSDSAGANARVGDGNAANWGGAQGDGAGLIDGVGNTLNSLLGRSSGYTSNESYAGPNFSSTDTDSYAAPSPAPANSADDSPPESLLAATADTVGGVVHDVGQAASSLLDGQGNRIDPSNLSDKSFNDWASAKADPGTSSRAGDQGGRAASGSDTPESAATGTAQGRFVDPNENAALQADAAASAFAGEEEEEGMASLQTEGNVVAGFDNRAPEVPDQVPVALGSEQPEPAGLGLPDGLAQDDAEALPLVAQNRLTDTGKPLPDPSDENGSGALNPQTRSAQVPADGTRVNAVTEQAQADAASARQAAISRPLDFNAATRAANFSDAGLPQTANEQTRQPLLQTPIYVGEGRQTAPEKNPPLVASVERVDAVAANWNIEQDEMNRTEHLDTQQTLLRQFTPALIGISALISSAIGSTTMLVSPGGGAAPFLLGVSALLFAMGAWRGSDAARAQWAQEKSWAQMLGDPVTRQSLLATGANGLGLAGSVGLSLIALI